MDTRLKTFNEYISGRLIGAIDYATFRCGDKGIEARGLYDINGSKPSLVEKYKFNEFRSLRVPHRLCGHRGEVMAHSDFGKIPCYGFKIPIGKIVVSPKNNIFVETNDGEIVEIEHLDTIEGHVMKGFSLDEIMTKFEVVKF